MRSGAVEECEEVTWQMAKPLGEDPRNSLREKAAFALKTWLIAKGCQGCRYDVGSNHCRAGGGCWVLKCWDNAREAVDLVLQVMQG